MACIIFGSESVSEQLQKIDYWLQSDIAQLAVYLRAMILSKKAPIEAKVNARINWAFFRAWVAGALSGRVTSSLPHGACCPNAGVVRDKAL